MPNEVNPNMVILAREAKGLTQSQLANKLGVTQAIVSRIEAGLMPVSEITLQKIVECLQYPPNFFYEQADIYPLGIHFYRKAKGIPQKILTEIKALSNIERIRMENLVRSIEFDVRDIPNCEIDEIKYHSPRDVALAVRYAWSIPSGRIENMTALLEDAGIIVVFIDFNTKQYDAHSVPINNGKYIVFVNSNMPGDRIRFSLAHELGHMVMHETPHDKIEDEANEFAGELLMPSDIIYHQLTSLSLARLVDLKKVWKVSMQAILKRAGDLNRITLRQSQYLWMQMGKLGYRKNEPITLEKEEPSLIKEMMETYLKYLGYTEDELKHLLYLDDDEYERFGPTKTNSQRMISNVHQLYPKK